MLFVLVVLAGLIIVIGCQQLLPAGRPLPFGRINGNMTRITGNEKIIDAHRIDENREITLLIQDYKATYKVKDLGISLDEEATVAAYYPQSRLRRLIPFSVLSQMYQNKDPVFTSSPTSLFAVTSAIADEVNIDPENALIDTSGGIPRIQPSKDGLLFEPERVSESVFQAIIAGRDSVILASRVIRPEVSTPELEKAVGDFLPSIPEQIVIYIGSDQKSLDRTTMLGWLSYKIEDGQPIILFDDTLLGEYASRLGDEFAAGSQPTATLVNLVDGKETGRLEGSPGKAIDPAALSDALLTALRSDVDSVEATLIDVPSPIKYARSYTRSSEGLTEMLSQITAGKEISIKFVDINARGWNVGSRENTPAYMASTYKLFVAYSVLKRIDEGSLRMNDQINGKSYDACIQTMIIDSNNECAIAMAEKIGWITIQNEGKALGASGLDWRTELTGTVNDAAVIPTKLARGEILSDSGRTYLLDLMKRQRFRSGIPAGTTYVVANKVGFFEGWLNDTAIVYAGDVPYVLAIYTKNESWKTIADITTQIESLIR